jgi:hypothetical protein
MIPDETRNRSDDPKLVDPDQIRAVRAGLHKAEQAECLGSGSFERASRSRDDETPKDASPSTTSSFPRSRRVCVVRSNPIARVLFADLTRRLEPMAATTDLEFTTTEPFFGGYGNTHRHPTGVTGLAVRGVR